MKTLEIKSLLREVCHEIGGEWLMVGGAFILLEYDEHRPVKNVDLVPILHPNLSFVEAEYALMTAAARLKFDPQVVTVNTKDYLDTFPGWPEEALEWRKGKVGSVAKPSLALLVAMKLKRGSTVDLNDLKLAVEKEGRGAFDERRFRRLANSLVQVKFDGLRARLGL